MSILPTPVYLLRNRAGFYAAHAYEQLSDNYPRTCIGAWGTPDENGVKPQLFSLAELLNFYSFRANWDVMSIPVYDAASLPDVLTPSELQNPRLLERHSDAT